MYTILGWQKSSKWPPFKMVAKLLTYIELSDKHTYLGLNYILVFQMLLFSYKKYMPGTLKLQNSILMFSDVTYVT